jgi:hypothetical protein
MADYFPLLARALDTMSDRSPETRRVVYARAKAALTSQLRSLDPPLGEAEIGRETQALDEAIARAEQVYGSETAPPPQPVFDPPATETVPEAGQRPRVEPQQPAIRRGGGRNRSRTVVIGLGAIMVPAAIVAWLWRDHPTPVVQEVARVQPAAPAAPTDSKFADRIGGEAARPVQAPAPAPPASPTAPASRLPRRPHRLKLRCRRSRPHSLNWRLPSGRCWWRKTPLIRSSQRLQRAVRSGGSTR